MPKIVSSGKCRLCGQLVGKAQMSTHLKKCRKGGSPDPAKGVKTTRCFHLVVGATYDPAYWLHLELPAETTFGDLDRVLRDIWLECCGHMSAFRFPQQRVRPTSPRDFAQMLEKFARGGFEDELKDEQQMMGERLGKRLHPGVTLDYEYDFGSTTNLSLRVLDDYDCSHPKPKIRLEKRRGKCVTVIFGLHTYGAKKLNEIAVELKSKLGTGGTVKNGTIEVQGDKTVAVQNWFNRDTL